MTKPIAAARHAAVQNQILRRATSDADRLSRGGLVSATIEVAGLLSLLGYYRIWVARVLCN